MGVKPKQRSFPTCPRDCLYYFLDNWISLILFLYPGDLSVLEVGSEGQGRTFGKVVKKRAIQCGGISHGVKEATILIRHRVCI